MVEPERLFDAVERIGYHARPEARHEHDGLQGRLVVALVLSLPLVLLAMIPPLQFSGWQWLSLMLATPVVFWCGRAVPPGRAR